MATSAIGPADRADPADPAQPRSAPVAARHRSEGKVWPGYTAAVLAVASASVSFYWALGGSLGLSSLGGRLEELARARDPALIRVVWVTVVLKVVAALVGLALVQSWGGRLPRRLLLTAAWGGAVVLTAWGTLAEISVGLIAAEVSTPEPRPAGTALVGRLVLWEPWFIVWGVSLGLAARLAQRRLRVTLNPSTSANPALSEVSRTAR